MLALAVSSDAVIVARDTPTILADIATIDSDTKSLTTAVNAFASINDAAGLISAEGALETAIKKGTSDTQATTGPISDADASSVISAVKNLIPSIVAALNAVVSKNGAFTSAGVQSVVAGDLTAVNTP
ncbi:cell wall galactomannoprotein [Leptodontidium sp. 2 PMI_412]|nr:cell wall galactomannoprotein [Leptodontidium sp. 2 PMI_412]